MSGARTSIDLDASTATVHLAARLRGEIRMPGDKSVSHRALLLAALAEGTSRIEGAGDGADVRSTAGIVRALGKVPMAWDEVVEPTVPKDVIIQSWRSSKMTQRAAAAGQQLRLVRE